MQGRGPKPRNEGGLEKLENERKLILPYNIWKEQPFQHPSFNEVILDSWLPKLSQNELVLF